MKKIISILIVSTFLVSCNKIDELDKSVDPLIKEFVDQFNEDAFKDHFGHTAIIKLNESKSEVFYYMGIPEVYIITSVRDSLNNELGKIYSLKNQGNSFTSAYVITKNYNKNSGNGEISYHSIDFSVNVSFNLRGSKIIDIQEKNLNSNFKANSERLNPEPSCTGSCYKKAKDACDADPDCKLACDLMANCVGSMAIACFIHCLLK
jgi:hypothetical protein